MPEMKNLRFIPYTYRQQTIVKVALAFDRELMRTIAHKRTIPMPHYGLKKGNSISSHSYFFKNPSAQLNGLHHCEVLLGHPPNKTTERLESSATIRNTLTVHDNLIYRKKVEPRTH